MQLKIGSHLGRKTVNKCLNVREQVEMVETNQDGPFPSPAVL